MVRILRPCSNKKRWAAWGGRVIWAPPPPRALVISFHQFHIQWHPGCLMSARYCWMLQCHWCWSQCLVVNLLGLQMLPVGLLWFGPLVSCFAEYLWIFFFSWRCTCHSSCILLVSVVSRHYGLHTSGISFLLHQLVPFCWLIHHLLVVSVSICTFALFFLSLRVWH
jgi:hypothetical protein